MTEKNHAGADMIVTTVERIRHAGSDQIKLDALVQNMLAEAQTMRDGVERLPQTDTAMRAGDDNMKAAKFANVDDQPAANTTSRFAPQGDPAAQAREVTQNETRELDERKRIAAGGKPLDAKDNPVDKDAERKATTSADAKAAAEQHKADEARRAKADHGKRK